jgi:hypothetical protein
VEDAKPAKAAERAAARAERWQARPLQGQEKSSAEREATALRLLSQPTRTRRQLLEAAMRAAAERPLDAAAADRLLQQRPIRLARREAERKAAATTAAAAAWQARAAR